MNIILLIIIVFIVYKRKVRNVEKFYYETSCSAPILSPVRVLVANFISESGTLHADFGNVYNCSGMGCGQNPYEGSLGSKYCIPKAIEAVWISYVDKKVYHIRALLPYDELLTLFKRYEGLDHLDLCFLPGGILKLYVKGGGWKRLLEWSVTGKEETNKKILEDIYFEYGKENKNDFFQEIYKEEEKGDEKWLRYFKKNGSPADLLNKYFNRFNYEINFEFDDRCTTNVKVWSPFSNNETFPVDCKNEIKTLTMVKEIESSWDTKNYHYTCFMYFNEEEMLRVFEEAYGEDKTQKGEFKIKVGKDNNQFDISLNVGDKCIKLEKTEIDVFQDPIDNPDGDGTLIYDNYDERHNYFADDEKYVVD